ncbi:MAG TPA: serine hydrolase [Dehalococcoidia bacterium]|nr:serine hydrolase [Dehalococcoidia bacterium]
MADRGGWGELERLAETAERTGGTVGYAVLAPNGQRVERHGERSFRAASTVKIPIMIEVFRQIDRGERSLADRHTLRPEEKTPGSGVLLHLHDGLQLTLGDLLYLMIAISDNAATNILIELAGMANVNATMRELGMVSSTLGRPMKGRPAQGEEQENWATPNDYVRVVQAILNNEAASPSACAQMTALLEQQQNRRRIARFLPEREGVRWGSKTGSIAGVTNDAGFVTVDGRTLILAVYCERLPDQHEGERVIGEIARTAFAASGLIEPLYTS